MRRTFSERLQKKAFKMEIVNQIKDLNPVARGQKIEELVAKKYTIPYSTKETLSKTSIYRWLKEFRENNACGQVLMGKVRCDRDKFKKLTMEQEKALLLWRYDNPYRSTHDLKEELMVHDLTRSDTPPSESTIARFLRINNLSRSVLIKNEKPKLRLAFEAEYPQQLWMADTKGPNVYVEDKEFPGRKIAAKPIAIIDDHSRYIVAIRYVLVENEYVVMELLCQAICLYGIPEILYVDRGSPYRGKNLKRAMSLLGCNIIHTQKRDCQAKGKIEKFLRTCHERFEHELIASGKEATLEEYNKYLEAYIAQDYHRSVHSSTGKIPEESFFEFPPKLRRWLAKDALSLIFLPCKTAQVSKTGLVRLNKLKYLVNDALLWGKKVEVRYEYSQVFKIYVWYEDRYYGESYLYTETNDFIKREEITARINKVPDIKLPAVGEVPIYSRFDRQLAKHRAEMEATDINSQLAHNKHKKEQVRADLVKSTYPKDTTLVKTSHFGVEEFIYLLMKLLRKKFTPSERLATHVLWNSTGPIEEQLVRKTVGRLLGEEHPLEDVKGYLEEIRLGVITQKKL